MTIHRLLAGMLVWGVALALSGCASPLRAWYEGLQNSAQNQCDKQPPGAREDCLAGLNKKTYDAYDKERTAPR